MLLQILAAFVLAMASAMPKQTKWLGPKAVALERKSGEIVAAAAWNLAWAVVAVLGAVDWRAVGTSVVAVENLIATAVAAACPGTSATAPV